MNQLETINTFLQVRGYDLRILKGQDMNNPSIVSKALTKREALDALDLYERLSLPILGGDVFSLNRIGEINWTYDNWYCEKYENESRIEYTKRSVEETKQYINEYQKDSLLDTIYLFDIVYERYHKSDSF